MRYLMIPHIYYNSFGVFDHTSYLLPPHWGIPSYPIFTTTQSRYSTIPHKYDTSKPYYWGIGYTTMPHKYNTTKPYYWGIRYTAIPHKYHMESNTTCCVIFILLIAMGRNRSPPMGTKPPTSTLPSYLYYLWSAIRYYDARLGRTPFAPLGSSRLFSIMIYDKVNNH